MQHNTSSDISKFITADQADNSYEHMYDAGLELPPYQRALMAQHYYQRVHLRNLGLRLIATCEFHILKQVFGAAAEVVYSQSQELAEAEQSRAQIRNMF